MSGYIDNLNSEQERCLREFKVLIEKELVKLLEENPDYIQSEADKEMLNDDRIYLKFLRARKFNIEDSVKSYITTVKWRKSFHGIGVENVTEDMIEIELKYGKSFFYKYDKENRSILYVKPKLHDPSAATPEEIEKSIVWHAETGRKLLKPGQETGTIVYDMEGFSLANMDYVLMKLEIQILERYYPESMGVTLIINAPFVFWGCWQIIKPWIDPVARDKILFIKKEELVNYIDKDSLLQEYGGNDPYVYSYVPVSERGGSGYIPPWELPWSYEWRETLTENNNNNSEDTPKKVYRRPILQNDGTITNCNSCKVGFGWITRKHHCRGCGMIFCANCCPSNQLVEFPKSFKYPNPERVCNDCFQIFSNLT